MDDGGEKANLTLYDYRMIHLLVCNAVAIQTCGVIAFGSNREVYMAAAGETGFIDVYVSSQNCYYEIKSQNEFSRNPGNRVTRQLEKYKTIAKASNGMLPGEDSSIEGFFYYKDWLIEYSYKEPGVVTYTYKKAVLRVPAIVPEPERDKASNRSLSSALNYAFEGGIAQAYVYCGLLCSVACAFAMCDPIKEKN